MTTDSSTTTKIASDTSGNATQTVPSATPATTSSEPKSSTTPSPSLPNLSVEKTSKRKKLLGIVALILLIGALSYFAYYWFWLSHYEETDDAYVGGNQVYVNAQTGGTVTAIGADDNQTVKAGDILVKFDTADTQVALTDAQAKLGEAVRQVRQQIDANAEGNATVNARLADTQRVRSDADRTESELKRVQADQARAAADVSKAQSDVVRAQSEVTRLQSEVAKAQSDKTRIESDQKRAQSEQARAQADVARAQSDLQRTQGDLKRRMSLAGTDAMSNEEIQHAQQAEQNAQANLQAAQASLQSVQNSAQAAQANVQTAQATIQAAQASVQTAKANVQTANANLQAAQAGQQSAQAIVKSAQSSIQSAQGAIKVAQANEQVAQRQAATRASQIAGTTLTTHPSVLRARAAYVQAYLAMIRSDVVAPVSGTISKRNVQVGQRLAAGSQLMAIVPMDSLWVDANFKEVQLRQLKVGQSVTLTSDLYGSKVEYSGRLAGFSAGTGGAFSLLPPQNATGNWIKVVQRVPVRIQINSADLKKNMLRIGLSMRVVVDIDSPLAPVPAIGQSAMMTTVFDQQLAAAQAKADAIVAHEAAGKP